jgi:hypothetical protein
MAFADLMSRDGTDGGTLGGSSRFPGVAVAGRAGEAYDRCSSIRIAPER